MTKLGIISLIVGIIGTVLTALNTQQTAQKQIDKRFDEWEKKHEEDN
nr:MAG TPA: protein of unknown function (DUF5408) [Caudoviricetes sp.]